ncbi:MAG: amidohydrolase family protein, partial [Ilumatobacter sp.]|nr:amidohydrolase family protein [Ilumatobacter sp.]
EQRLSIEQALRAVTIDAAHSWRKEDELGSIEVGKIANFTVVDQSPLDAAPVRLDEIEVLGTVFRGEWFAVPDDVRKRVAAAASRGPGALQLIAGSDMHDEYGATGCICDVARAVASAIA